MPLDRTVTTDPPSRFPEHPLIEFKGTVSDITDRAVGTRGNLFIIIFSIKDIEVIESREPFSFPVTQIEIMERNFPKTEWTIFTESLRDCGYTGDINGLIEKRMHWKRNSITLNGIITPANPGNMETGEPATPAVYGDVPGKAWQILEIEGVRDTTNDLIDRVSDIADGKDAGSFKAAFMSDMSLQGMSNYNDIAQQAMNNTLLDFLVSINKLTFDGTSYHKVG